VTLLASGMTKKKSTKPKKLRPDVNETAYRVMLEATKQKAKTVPPSERTEEQKDQEAVKRGRKGGEKGGPARVESLTERQRRQLAKKAAKKRWEEEEEAG